MTTGELLSSKSTVSNTTALQHLLHIDCSGGAGTVRYIAALKVKYNKSGYVALHCKKVYNTKRERHVYKAVYDKSATRVAGGTKKEIKVGK